MDKTKNAGLPASIQYVPVCTGCGEKIGERVTVIRTRCLNDKIIRATEDTINPEACPNCGARFTTLEVCWPDLKEEIG